MLRKISLTGCLFAIYFLATAQDNTQKTTISGSLDGYYRNDFTDQLENNKTSFTNSNKAFELGSIGVKITSTALHEKATAVLDLGLGSRAKEFSYNDNNFLSAIKQAYISIAASKHLKLIAGKFGTHIGYEYVDAGLNKNYSMSYMFTNGPFFYTGAKAEYTIKNWQLMAGITNFTDYTTNITETTAGGKTKITATKTVIAQIKYTSSNSKHIFYANYSGFGGSKNGLNPSGLEATNQLDFAYTSAFSGKINVGYNGTVQMQKTTLNQKSNWWGQAVYFIYDASKKLGFTYRLENMVDSKNLKIPSKNILAQTLTGNIKLNSATILQPEIRYEKAAQQIFKTTSGNTSSSSIAALIALVVQF